MEVCGATQDGGKKRALSNFHPKVELKYSNTQARASVVC
jgi:hypothetical protein